MESIVAEVRNATRLETYDFVDVVRPAEGIGWQVKSTKASTPVTWKRAKLPNQVELIKASQTATGAQVLGNSIIEFCNAHARESLKEYGLSEIGYSRLLIRADLSATYFERILVTAKSPELFKASEFSWQWSIQKQSKKKEQLSALHGIHVKTGKKWWAWHGLGENQLHFSGETAWWPTAETNAITFTLPSLVDRMSMQDLIELLDTD